MTFHLTGSLRRGFTAIEIIIVMVIIGIMSAVALPFIRNATVKSGVSGALAAITSLHAVARNSAIQRGRTAVLVLNASTNTVVVVLQRPGSTTAVDTVGKAENLYTRFGVTLSTTNSQVSFNPRGIGASSNTTVIVTRSGYADTLVISAAGRLLR